MTGTNRVHRIAVIAGDGIGKEVMPEGLRVLEAASKKFGFELTRSQKYANGSAGGSTVPTRTSQTSVTVGTINTVDPERAVKKLQEMQRDALAVAGINA